MPVRISVYIVSYNQEKYIGKAIDSILEQSVRPYEICIFDDHSTDRTWDIIQSYLQQYPDRLKAHRHAVNQGIFKNFNYAERSLSGNLITCVAGDDYIMPGYFEAVTRFIEENKLQPDTDRFIMIPNIINLFENGTEVRHSNMMFQDRDILPLRVRGLIDDRYGMVSRAAFEKTAPYLEDIGIHADFIWGIDRYLHADRVFFIDGYYSVYRMGVGIVSRTRERDAAFSLNRAVEVVLHRFHAELKPEDRRFLRYLQAKSRFQTKKTLGTYMNLLWHTFINTGNFGNSKKQIKALLFPILPYRLKMLLFRNKYLERLSK